jgi:hypothetical protein
MDDYFKELQSIKDMQETSNSILSQLHTQLDQFVQKSASDPKDQSQLGFIFSFSLQLIEAMRNTNRQHTNKQQAFVQLIQNLHEFFHHKCQNGIIRQLKELLSLVKQNEVGRSQGFCISETIGSISSFFSELSASMQPQDQAGQSIKQLYAIIYGQEQYVNLDTSQPASNSVPNKEKPIWKL